jgi:ABC-2 type transport system permease protein
VAFGANIVLGILTTLILLGNDLPLAGSVVTGMAICGTGCVFALVAAVIAQFFESARTANSLNALAIGTAFLLRAIGDSIGTLARNGMVVHSLWPSWLSPFGWAQQIQPLTQNNWWIFSLFGGLAAALLSIAFFLTNKRDVGLGLFPARKGPATAPANLLSPFGLAWRLQKGILRGWAIAVVVTAASYGLTAKEFKDLFAENTAAADFLKQLGGSKDLTDALLGALVAYMALTIAAYAIQALQRLRSEESGGQLESILATNVSRSRWLFSHLGCALIGVSGLLLLSGLSMGVAYVLAAGRPLSELLALLGATFAQLPAVLVVVSFAVLAFGILPRMAIGLAWTSFGLCLVVAQFGAIFKLSHWALDISPFTHSPLVLINPFSITPVVSLLGVAFILCLAGFVSFRRRDLMTA